MRRDRSQGAVVISGLLGMVLDHCIGVKDGARPFNVSTNVGTALQPFDAALEPVHRLSSFSRTGALLQRGDALIQFVDFNRLDVTDLEDSIENREGHNEWGIRNYVVRGLFTIEPIEIWKPSQTPYGPVDGIVPYSLDRVRLDFPEQRIYSFGNGDIVELHPREHRPIVIHEEIYR